MSLSPGKGHLRAIVGFHQDEAGDWVADLSCGHSQHVRHRPPWEVRTWVLTAEGREQHIGKALSCVKCGDEKLSADATHGHT
jgi:hypothetical protein